MQQSLNLGILRAKAIESANTAVIGEDYEAANRSLSIFKDLVPYESTPWHDMEKAEDEVDAHIKEARKFIPDKAHLGEPVFPDEHLLFEIGVKKRHELFCRIAIKYQLVPLI